MKRSSRKTSTSMTVKKAVRVLHDNRFSKTSKALAGSVLSQAK